MKPTAPEAALPPAPAPAPAEEDDEATYVCPFTKKVFKSRGAFESYKASKKYRTLVAKDAARPIKPNESAAQPPPPPPESSVGDGSAASLQHAQEPQDAAQERPDAAAQERPDAAAQERLGAQERPDAACDDADSDSGDSWVDVDEPW
jgi:hypothetical protein